MYTVVGKRDQRVRGSSDVVGEYSVSMYDQAVSTAVVRCSPHGYREADSERRVSEPESSRHGTRETHGA
jgi:hypothetical protein